MDASTPLGTSQAKTVAPDARLIASIAPAAGSRGSPAKPVPRIASTIAAGRPSAASEKDSGAGPGRRSRLVSASPRKSSAAPVSRTDTSRPCERSTRATTEAVAAVVALPAHDNHPARRRPLLDKARQPGAGPFHQLDAGDPALADRPLVERALLRRVRSGSSQSGRVIRGSRRLLPRSACGSARFAPRPRARVARSATAPCRSGLGRAAVPDDLDVAEAPALQSQGLRHRLLGAEPRRQVLSGPSARGRICAFAIGEQPLGQPGPALERPFEPLDLEQVDPDPAAA